MSCVPWGWRHVGQTQMVLSGSAELSSLGSSIAPMLSISGPILQSASPIGQPQWQHILQVPNSSSTSSTCVILILALAAGRSGILAYFHVVFCNAHGGAKPSSWARYGPCGSMLLSLSMSMSLSLSLLLSLLLSARTGQSKRGTRQDKEIRSKQSTNWKHWKLMTHRAHICSCASLLAACYTVRRRISRAYCLHACLLYSETQENAPCLPVAVARGAFRSFNLAPSPSCRQLDGGTVAMLLDGRHAACS